MKRKRSSFDNIQSHLSVQGCRAPVADNLQGDLELLVRRCDEVRSLGEAYGSVELSPYMYSLLRVKNTAPASNATMPAVAVAGV
jgi:hypothetical protein